MADYIDREKLIRDLIDKGFYPAIVKRAIENTPTEDVVPRSECRIREFPSIDEILKDGCHHYKSKSLLLELPCRCKDCKHSKQPYIEYDEVFECHADTHYTGIRLVEADDFCKHAELK